MSVAAAALISFAAGAATIELPVLSLWFVNLSGGKGTPSAQALQGWAQMRLEQLDAWLAHREFIATDEFTVADILMAHVLGSGTDAALLDPHPNLRRYVAHCTGRPAWRRTLDAYHARVEATYLRGEQIYTNERGVIGKPRGQYLFRPTA